MSLLLAGSALWLQIMELSSQQVTGAKFKTVSQMFMIIVLIADLGGAFDIVGTVLIWLSLILTVVSLIDYIAKNVQVLTQGGM